MAKYDPLQQSEPTIAEAIWRMINHDIRVFLGIDPAPPPPTKEQEREREIYRLKYMIEEDEQEIAGLEYSIEQYKKRLAELEKGESE